MTMKDVVRNRILHDLDAYWDEATEAEDDPDSISLEERVQDFYTFHAVIAQTGG